MDGTAKQQSTDSQQSRHPQPSIDLDPPCLEGPRYRTVVMSDVHLGSSACRADEAIAFLESVTCDTLVLNGDIIDAWQLRRGSAWTAKHTRFVSLLLEKAGAQGTKVIYIRGNHDDVLGRILPMTFGNLTLVEEHVLETAAGPYLCVHGDAFDALLQTGGFWHRIGDLGYTALLHVNRGFNRARRWAGKDNFSLAQAVKSRIGSAVEYVDRFERYCAEFAKSRGCVGVIAGHIHCPADRRIDGVHYLNTGDWVESITAVVEDDAGLRLVRPVMPARRAPGHAAAPGAGAGAKATAATVAGLPAMVRLAAATLQGAGAR